MDSHGFSDNSSTSHLRQQVANGKKQTERNLQRNRTETRRGVSHRAVGAALYWRTDELLQAGLPASGSSSAFAFPQRRGCSGTDERVVARYGGATAQAFHLLPYSPAHREQAPAIDALQKYTGQHTFSFAFTSKTNRFVSYANTVGH